MNGYDIQLYNTVQNKAKANDVKISVRGEDIQLARKKTGLSLGVFKNITAVYMFLCGYEAGKSTLK